MIAYFMPSYIHKYCFRVDTVLVDRIPISSSVLSLKEIMVLSSEHFIVLYCQLLLRSLRQIMYRFSLLIVQ